MRDGPSKSFPNDDDAGTERAAAGQENTRIRTKTKPCRSSIERDGRLGSTGHDPHKRGRPTKMFQFSSAIPVVEMMIVGVFRSDRRWCRVHHSHVQARRSGTILGEGVLDGDELEINLFADRRGVGSAFKARIRTSLPCSPRWSCVGKEPCSATVATVACRKVIL